MSPDPSNQAKPVAPTQPQPSTKATNPREIRQERPDPRTQTVGTPDGSSSAKGAGGSSK
jgi:hypothetical protein